MHLLNQLYLLDPLPQIRCKFTDNQVKTDLKHKKEAELASLAYTHLWQKLQLADKRPDGLNRCFGLFNHAQVPGLLDGYYLDLIGQLGQLYRFFVGNLLIITAKYQ